MFTWIHASGNTSGAYAFLRWCAALVLTIGILAGADLPSAESYTTGPADTVVHVTAGFSKTIGSDDYYNLNVLFKKPYGLTVVNGIVGYTVLIKPLNDQLRCRSGSDGNWSHTTPTLHDGYYKIGIYGYDSSTLPGGSVSLSIPDGNVFTKPPYFLVGGSTGFFDFSCTVEGSGISIGVGAYEAVLMHEGQVVGSPGTVLTVPSSSLDAGQEVQIVRDDRCAEYDAVEWVLRRGSNSPLIEAPIQGSNTKKAYCEGEPSQSWRYRFCLIPNADGKGDFPKTVTLADSNRNKMTGSGDSYTSTAGIWNRQTAGTAPAAPSVSVYGDHRDLSKSSAVVTWNEVDDPANSGKKAYGYDVVYHVNGSWWRAASCDLPHALGDVNRVLCTGSMCFYRLNDLDPDAAYRFSVRAHGRGGVSAWAQNAMLPVASAVSGLSAVRRTNGDVRVSWMTQASSPSYHLTYFDGKTNRNQRSLASSGTPSSSPFDMKHADLDPHRAYRIGLRQADADGNYAGRWSPWRDAGPAAPHFLPAVSGLSAFWNSAYAGRLAVRWDGLPGASGYHITISVLDSANQFTNNLVTMHHTGTWLLVTDRAQGLQLCPGDRVRIGVRALYEPDGQWNNGSDLPDVYGPWRDVPQHAWANVNKKDPPSGVCN